MKQFGMVELVLTCGLFALRWNFLLLLSVCSAVPSGEEDYRAQGKLQKTSKQALVGIIYLKVFHSPRLNLLVTSLKTF